jgi:hypothetical protein
LSIISLADAIRKEFSTLGVPDILEMALVSSTGKVVYSDLGKSALAKVSPFYNSMLIMTLGDTMSLTVDPTKTMMISRVSNSTILVALTNKKIGIVLTKLKGVGEKFGRLLDEIVPQQEPATSASFASIQAEAKPSQPAAPTPAPDVAAPRPMEQHEEPERLAATDIVARIAESLGFSIPKGPEQPVSAGVAATASPTFTPPAAITVNEARAIIDEARESNLTLRALGGTAVAMRCPSAGRRALVREYPDIYLVGHAKEIERIREVLTRLEFEPDERFNAAHGAKRLKFFNLKGEMDVNIFLDVFEMWHKLDLKDRLDLDEYTISLADLLITKLQIVELKEKDVRDVTAILLDHAPGKGRDEIDGDYIAKLCSDDWGLWKTLSMNSRKIMESLNGFDLREDEKQKVKLTLEDFLKKLEAEPKSTRWKTRASIGEKSKWYITVEEETR